MAGIDLLPGISQGAPRAVLDAAGGRGAARPGQAAALGGKQAGDLLLIKTVLDRKDFQRARREIEDLGWSGDAPPAAESAAPAAAAPAEARGGTVEVDATAVHLEVQGSSGSLALDYTRVQVRVRREAPAAQAKDPLVLDLDGRGPATTGRTGARVFDLAADGSAAPTSFVAGGSAFLALDRNGNGRIDDGGELFGDQHGAADGYEELRRFDANADGTVDAEDPVYGRLLLLYGSGATTGLAAAGIRSLSLEASAGSGTASGGDAILRSATAQREDGSTLGTYALALNTFDRTV